MSNAKDEVEKKYVEIVEKHLNGIIKWLIIVNLQ
jgi:hypothetical protein